jgi:outer membrane protein TolC
VALVFLFPATAQDSIRLLSESQFMEGVRRNHPVAKQAALLVAEAKAGVLASRGNFDPVVSVDVDRKVFNEKDYFNYFSGEVAIPTWFGVELYGGIEDNTGQFINTERTLNQSSYAGVSIPLLKDLILDNRRATLQKAKIFQQQSVAERRNQLNDLLMDALESYWNWSRDYQQVKVLDTIIRLNELRYALVLDAYRQGDRAAMDTAEAQAQLQQFQQAREEAWLNYRKASLLLSNFIWLENNQPAYLKETTLPDSLWVNVSISSPDIATWEDWLNKMIVGHPKLRMMGFKIQSLQVDRELKFQSLLPKADLKYNFLQQGYEAWKGWGGALLENNYKFGLNIAVPLPNRGGIGAYRAARIKITSTEWERDYLRLQLENKLRYHYAEVFNVSRQCDIISKAYQNYRFLLNAEQMKFGLGETTLFILNARENKLLETRQKLLSLKAKYFQSLIRLSWASGALE